jgi:hypothetical protein
MSVYVNVYRQSDWGIKRTGPSFEIILDSRFLAGPEADRKTDGTHLAVLVCIRSGTGTGVYQQTETGREPP